MHAVECFPSKGFPDCYIFVRLIYPGAKILEVVFIFKGGAITGTQGLRVLDVVCKSFGLGPFKTKTNLFALCLYTGE